MKISNAEIFTEILMAICVCLVIVLVNPTTGLLLAIFYALRRIGDKLKTIKICIYTNTYRIE